MTGTNNSYFLLDASYWRLKNLAIGYNIPSKLTHKIGFNFSSAEQLADEVHHLYQNRAQLNVMAERTKKFFDAHCDAATIYRTYSDWVELLEKDFRECTFNSTDL